MAYQRSFRFAEQPVAPLCPCRQNLPNVPPGRTLLPTSVGVAAGTETWCEEYVEMSDTQQQESGSGLRNQLEQQVEKSKALSSELEAARQELRTYRFRDAGLDPDTGMGKAIAKTYQGEDLSPEAILAFAKDEYGYEPSKTEATETNAAPEATAQQAQAQQGQARLDAVDAAKLPTDQPSIEQRILDAQKAGDWDTSRALKHQLLDEQRKTARV